MLFAVCCAVNFYNAGVVTLGRRIGSREVWLVAARWINYLTVDSLESGLPDGIFPKQKFQFGLFFEGTCKGRCWYIFWIFDLGILRPLCIFCDHLVYFMLIRYIFFHFGMLHQEKSGNPAVDSLETARGKKGPPCLGSFQLA
jgi:hypothetical protein